jgi:hypothetical protein
MMKILMQKLFNHFPGLKAFGADPNSFSLAALGCPDFLQVRKPAFLGLVVCMAYIKTCLWSFSA